MHVCMYACMYVCMHVCMYFGNMLIKKMPPPLLNVIT